LICFQFHHWIHNYDLLFFFQIYSSFFWFWLDPFMNLIFLFNFSLEFKIISCPLIYFFISNLVLILLIIILCCESFCIIYFFISSFDIWFIENWALWFFIWDASSLVTRVMSLKSQYRLISFFFFELSYYFIFQCCLFRKIGFVILFGFLQSGYLDFMT
jgi:hypothetical protein